MKNSVQNAATLPMVKASTTTVTEQGFYQNNKIELSHIVKNKTLNRFSFILVLLMLFTSMNALCFIQIGLRGGKQSLLNLPQNNPGLNTWPIVQTGFKNLTNHDLCDFRLLFDKTRKATAITVSYGLPGVPDQNVVIKGDKGSEHVILNNCIPNNGTFAVKVVFDGQVKIIDIVPTNVLGADILINTQINPNAADETKKIKTTAVSGGQQTPTYEPSGFPSIDFRNKSGQKICDMEIVGSIPIDNVYVNDMPVDSIQVGGKTKAAPANAKSIHVFFPCIDNDGPVTPIAVKFMKNAKGEIVNGTFKFIPTDTLHGSMVTTIQDIREGTKSAEKKIEFKDTKTNNPSSTFVNNTDEDWCDLIIKSPDSKKILKVMVKVGDGDPVEWKVKPPAVAGTIVHVFAPAGKCIAPGESASINIIFSGEIGSFIITFTNDDSLPIYLASCTGGMNSLLMPNEYSKFGLTGRSGSYTAINQSCAAISDLQFTSPDTGITITKVTSTRPYVYNKTLQKLTFIPAISSGDTVIYDFVVNHLKPYYPLDTFPYTTVNVNVPGINLSFDGSAEVTPAQCLTATNGSIDLTVTGVSAPISYQWSNSSTTEDLYNITAGTYVVTVSAPSGCFIKTFNVTANQPSIEVVSKDISCNGTNDGGAIAVTDGIEPIAYQWSNGATTGIINGLAPGIYICTVSSAVGCVLNGITTISQPAPSPLAVTGTVANLNCNGDKSGSININVAGSVSVYLYNWSNGFNTQNLAGIKAGTYTVTVASLTGCSTTASFKVKQPAALYLTTSGTDVLCNGGNTGSATATAAGGTQPYVFQWLPGGLTGNTISELFAGTYVVTLIDMHGCTHSGSVNINQPLPLMTMAQPIGPGVAAVQANGGVPPYTFYWNTIPVQITPIATGLMPNQVYMYQVADQNYCMQTGTLFMPPFKQGSINDINLSTVPNPTTGIVTVSLDNFGLNNYALELTDIAGRIVYTANESAQQLQLDLSKYDDGIYSLKVSSTIGVKVVKLVLHKN